MATAAVSICLCSTRTELLKKTLQKPPLYLHITSTSKEGLEQAVQKIEDLMKQELPNLVDERRFRRRDVEQVERDEYGRVCLNELIFSSSPANVGPSPSVNGRKNGFLSRLSLSLALTFVLRL